MGNCQSSADHIQTQEDPNAAASLHSSPSLHFSENPHNESRWAQIYHAHHSRIVDPEDIHTVLDAAISASISHLRPAEMTLILRRIRKVVRTVMMSSQKVKTTKKKGNGYTISMNVMGGKRDKDKDKDKEKYSYNNGNSDMDSMDVRNLKSHAVYTKDHLLDEHVLRQIFVAGDRWIARGRKEKWVEQQYKNTGIRNTGTFREDEDGDSSQYTDKDAESASAVVNGSSHRHPNGRVYDLNEISKNKAKALEREKRRGTKNGKKSGTAKISPASTSASEADAETVDMVGSAYILLLHLSESRWDHVAAIAKQSAQNAGLELDVNRQTALQEQRKKDIGNINGNASNSQSAPAKQNSTNGHGHGNHMAPDVPPPPPMKAYNRAESNNSNGNGSNSSGANGDNKNVHIPPPTMPSGVSFQSLSCLISSVLRANRRQRLIILFHLLLDPMTLSQILNSHPNGGIPSWILECDQDWILSYASMSHDYYHGESLKVNVQNVIETISILLHSTNTSCDDSESERGDDQIHNNDPFDTDLEGANGMTNVNDIGAYAGVTVDGAAQTGIRQRALSYGDTKYHAAKMHVMLAGYLHQVREGEDAPSFENYTEGQWRDHLLNVFWKASRKYYHVEDEYDGEQMAWTMKQFVAWADDAMPDDGALDVILHQVFGMGLLPTPAMERKLVAESWVEWQLREMHLFNADEYEMTDTISLMTSGIFNLLSFSSSRDSTSDTDGVSGHDNMSNIEGANGGQVRREMNGCAVWGGIGGFDGRGGLGNGIMYCIDKQWWQKWTQYVGWEWDDDNHNANSGYTKRGCSKDRPQELSSDRLVDHESDTFIGGSLGSYELMKKELKKDVDYVLVPPGVWDILYELYAGGPPLPRMILKKQSGRMAHETSIDVTSRNRLGRPNSIPRSLNVLTHPWVVECHVCDPHQPYRRGDVGPMSVRIMASPQQPLWRLFAEVILRLPIVHPRGKDTDGRGRGRLWKDVDDEGHDDTGGQARFGPWRLLRKTGAAVFPVGDNIDLDKSSYNSFVSSWEEYANQATVESIGLYDGIRLKFEYALAGKDGKFTWPREAAAKAGLVHWDNREDNAFRRYLRGLDAESNIMSDVKQMLGTVIDAMDSAGRWYQAEIVDVDRSNFDDDEDDTVNSEDFNEEKDEDLLPGEVRAVKIDFRDVGGHEEWILVGSDRLAVKGRFTEDSMKSLRLDQIDMSSNGKQGSSETRSPLLVLRRSTSSKEPSNFQLSSAVCPFPGFGACGLGNLGNTCYMNSALQCMSYMPILRSYLLSSQFKKYGDMNKDNPLGTGGKLLEEMASLQTFMWSGKFGVRQPTKFRNQLGRAKQQYSAADQQDAQELLNDLIDSLHEDSNKVVKKPYVEGLEDNWVDQNELSRVGEESWRRFLRRNRSIISNIGMGQVLNRVTCPVCNYTSRSFDPFNMLSLPFPSVSEVVFKCIVLRSASPVNCPQTLNIKKESPRSWKADSSSAPSATHIIDEYIITMSRLADVSELKQKLHDLCGICLRELSLFILNNEDDENEEESGSDECDKKRLTPLPDKEGPCLEYARRSTPGEFVSPHEIPTTILAFESTLKKRPINGNAPAINISEMRNASKNQVRESVQGELAYYGDGNECRIYDSDPLKLAIATSRRHWPESASVVDLGLRVDAIDQRGNWFPGSIIEITKDHADPGSTKVKVHFDNFSAKWDLTYQFSDFVKGNVQPLYTQCHPKNKPLEFQVFHKHGAASGFDSQPFFIQCYTEWSVARAGAHILAQTARFLEQPMPRGLMRGDDLDKIFRDYRTAIAETIDLLLSIDREFVNLMLSEKSVPSKGSMALMHEKFNLRLEGLLARLPISVSICDTSQESDDAGDGDQLFDFGFDRVIGNCIHPKRVVVIEWKSIALRRGEGVYSLYSELIPLQRQKNSNPAAKQNGLPPKKVRPKHANGGMRLDVLLDEFCDEQKLEEEDCWRCPKCKDVREGRQSMMLWRLPDLLTFHLKRFNCSARWREKITTKINFPLTGLDMQEWFDKDVSNASHESYVYDLVGVVNHYGGMTGGHYVANCKVTACSPEGSEEVEHNFNGAGVHAFGTKEKEAMQTSSWKLGRSKEKENGSINTRLASSASKTAAESSEPLWLQFDDDSVEPIPPRNVNSENAYVLFYRRRRISPSNIARYSTLE